MELNYSNNKVGHTHSQLYKKAKHKVRAIRGFYLNLICYLVVIPILIWINLTYTPEILWVLFSACGWATGIAIHGLQVFRNKTFLSGDWEERKIRKFMDKEQLTETDLITKQ